MAGISTTLTIQDRMTNRLNQITSAFNRMDRAAQRADTTTRQADPGRGFSRGVPAIKRARDGVETFTKVQKEAEGGAKQIKSAWDGVGGAVKSAIAAIATKQMFDLTIGGALDLDSMEREFQARLGNDEVGSALFNKLQKQAQTSAFSLEDLAKNTSSFLSVTTDPKNIDGLNRIAEQLAVFDKTGQGLEGAGFSLKEALSGDIVSLAERFNMSKAQIRAFGIDKLGKSGDVEGFIRQFQLLLEAQNMGEEAYQKMLESPKTQLNMFLSNLKTGFATASEEALKALTPLIMQLNDWFASDDAQAFFARIGDAISTVAETILWVVDQIGKIATFVQENWSFIQPILAGVIAAMAAWKIATLLVAVAQTILNLIMLGSPITWIILAIVAIVAAIAWWVSSIGGLKVAWLIVCNAVLTAWDWVVISFMTGVDWVINLWNKLQLAFQTAGVNIANFMGDMKANVLTILQNMVNGAIDIINGFIGMLNKIPGVSIDLIGQMTFGATAQAENEAEKAARNKGLEAYRAQIDAQSAERDRKLAQMKIDAWVAEGKRKDEIAAAKAEKARKNAEAGANDTAAWEAFDGTTNVGNVDDVGTVGKIKDDVNIAEEDLKFLRDVAEMRFVQNFVTLTPTVAVEAQISERVDVDEVVSRIETKLENEFSTAAEGVYA